MKDMDKTAGCHVWSIKNKN